MSIGRGFTTGQYCRIEGGLSEQADIYTLEIGNDVQINDSCHIAAVEKVVIGDNVLIASRVFISDHDHGGSTLEELHCHPSDRPLMSAPVYIDNDVWIGEGVTILKGVTIGKNAVIGAGAVVTKDIPAYTVAAGIPAKVIKDLLQSSRTL